MWRMRPFLDVYKYLTENDSINNNVCMYVAQKYILLLLFSQLQTLKNDAILMLSLL